MQAALDTALEHASPSARQRFQAGIATPSTDRDQAGSSSADSRRGPGLDTGALLLVLTSYATAEAGGPVPDAVALGKGVSRAKRWYQAGRYGEVVAELPQLLGGLRQAAAGAGSGQGPRVHALTADAYQVGCSVLIKLADVPLAVLAAERSMTAAHASADQVAVAASGRAVLHALLAGGHARRGVEFGLEAAKRLAAATNLTTPAALSVYGALLLRTAVAAAAGEDRATAQQVLDEAHSCADRLGGDANAYWTLFGPTNVALHRVGVAAALGDAGQAIDHARQINPDLVPAAERRACLLIDVGRAYLQWGKYDQAYQALHAAQQAAPQELRHRPSARALVLAQRSPPSLLTRTRQLANQAGVVW
jgi:tetratricopeptide (TPR) repeat protein